MKVTVVNHTINGIEVHKVGCADVEKSKRRLLAASVWTETVPDGVDVAEFVATELNESFGWTPETAGDEPQPWHGYDVRVFPCVAAAAAGKVTAI